jgi:hypothetical protein
MSAADLEARRRLVHGFLLRCRAWGTDLEIPKSLGKLTAEPNPADAARLHQWTSWVAFLDHALGELDRGELDGWLTDPEPDDLSLSPAAMPVGAPRSSG